MLLIVDGAILEAKLKVVEERTYTQQLKRVQTVKRMLAVQCARQASEVR